jgi:hypothetical protein
MQIANRGRESLFLLMLEWERVVDFVDGHVGRGLLCFVVVRVAVWSLRWAGI